MIIKEIKWISEKALEASVLVADKNVEIWCFSHPCKFSVGEEVDTELYCFHCTNILRIEQESFSYIKKGGLEYTLTAMVLSKSEKKVLLGSIELELDIDFPGDVYFGDYIQFDCLRIDIW